MSTADHPTLDASVVIPLYNGGDTLPDQLDALCRQDFAGSWEVIIADNLSTDGGPLLAQRWQPSLPGLRIVAADQRRGPNHARNVGARAAAGRLVVFCDCDDVAESGWLSAMVRAGGTFDLFGGVLDTSQLNELTPRRWFHGEVSANRGRDDRVGLPIALDFLPFAWGANFGIRKEVFDVLGGFDESFDRVGGDDVEMSWRAALAGYRLGSVPDAVMMYRLRSSLWVMMKQHFRRGTAAPQLYHAFRAAQMPPRPVRSTVREWGSLVRHSPDLLGDTGARGRWLIRTSRALGRLSGSVTWRVPYL